MYFSRKRIISVAAGMLFTIINCLQLISPPITATASGTEIVQPYQFYELPEDNKFEISSNPPTQNADSSIVMGKLTICGDCQKKSTDKLIDRYEVADNENLTFRFDYDNTLLEASEEQWHLISDSCKSVDGKTLNESIKNGAILFQTSVDAKKWFTLSVETDILNSSDSANHSRSFSTQDMELINGCYYRILVVYKLERKIGSYHVIWDIADKHEDQRCAESFVFYAGYKNANDDSDLKQNSLNVGKFVETGTDNGYSGSNAISGDDPHFGWDLGFFTMYGFKKCSEKDEEKSQYTFLKDPDSKISLRFNLKEDIECLDGKSNLTINEDTNGYDQKLGVRQQNFGYGTMIIRYTDPKNSKHDAKIYTNYLAALTSPGANTKVQIFEEGDYEVALDYEIRNSKYIDKYKNYRYSFSFKIRNNDSMVFPRDLKNGSELKNGSATTEGFMIDFAGSQYLDVSVKIDTYTKNAAGEYVEDTRSNKAVENGQKFTSPGIYTITSLASKEADPDRMRKTEKKIYVGTDDIVFAHMNSANSAYSINQIASMVEAGATIDSNGIVRPAETTAPPEETAELISDTTITSKELTTQSSTATTQTTTVLESSANLQTTESFNEPESSSPISGKLPLIGGGIAAIAAGAFAVSRKTKKKQ